MKQEAQYDEEVNDELEKLMNEVEGRNKINLPNIPKEDITEDKDKVKTINVQKKVVAA